MHPHADARRHAETVARVSGAADPHALMAQWIPRVEGMRRCTTLAGRAAAVQRSAAEADNAKGRVPFGISDRPRDAGLHCSAMGRGPLKPFRLCGVRNATQLAAMRVFLHNKNLVQLPSIYVPQCCAGFTLALFNVDFFVGRGAVFQCFRVL